MGAISDWLDRFNELSEKGRTDVRRAINRLIAETFLLRRSERTKRDFYVIQTHEEIVAGYLGVMGWTLILHRDMGVCQVVSPDAQHRITLRAVDSVILLILRLLYEQKRKELTLAQDVMVRVEDIQSQYLALKIRSKPLDKAALRDAFKLFDRYHLVELLDADASDPDCRVIIHPSLALAVPLQTIGELHARLEKFGTVGEDDEDGGTGSAPSDEQEEVPA